jgi:hypothetical protein
MTVPKVKTVSVGGDRYYADDVTRDQVPGVTSILGVRAKPALINWAAKMAAEFAVDNIHQVSALAQTDRFAAIDLVKRAPTRSSGKAAGKGTEVHGIVERLLNGEMNVAVNKEVRPFIVQFQQFATEYKLEPVYNEITLWSDKYRYAGTADGLWKLTGEGIDEPGMLAVCDIKTGASGVWEDAALQLSAYKNADFILLPDGTRQVMPATSDQSWAIWLRPEGWALLPLDTGPQTFSTFIGLRKAFDWNKNRAKGAVGEPINKEPLRRGKK